MTTPCSISQRGRLRSQGQAGSVPSSAALALAAKAAGPAVAVRPFQGRDGSTDALTARNGSGTWNQGTAGVSGEPLLHFRPFFKGTVCSKVHPVYAHLKNCILRLKPAPWLPKISVWGGLGLTAIAHCSSNGQCSPVITSRFTALSVWCGTAQWQVSDDVSE